MRDAIDTKICPEDLKKKHRLNYGGAKQKIILKWIINKR